MHIVMITCKRDIITVTNLEYFFTKFLSEFSKRKHYFITECLLLKIVKNIIKNFW